MGEGVVVIELLRNIQQRVGGKYIFKFFIHKKKLEWESQAEKGKRD